MNCCGRNSGIIAISFALQKALKSSSDWHCWTICGRENGAALVGVEMAALAVAAALLLLVLSKFVVVVVCLSALGLGIDGGIWLLGVFWIESDWGPLGNDDWTLESNSNCFIEWWREGTIAVCLLHKHRR